MTATSTPQSRNSSNAVAVVGFEERRRHAQLSRRLQPGGAVEHFRDRPLEHSMFQLAWLPTTKRSVMSVRCGDV